MNRIVELGKARKVIVDAELPNKGTNNEGGKTPEKSKECKHIEDAPSYSLGLTQDGLILTAKNKKIQVPEVSKTVYIQNEVEEINQQTDKGTRERDVDAVESRNTTVDANKVITNEEAENMDVDMNQKMHENEKQENAATSKLNEEGVKNVDDNDAPNYSLGLTQDELILTADGQINKERHGHPKDLFVEYLERHRHLKAYEIKNAKIKKIDIPWATKQNEVDCGVFVMRQTEKYMGINEPFICGLNSIGMKKKGQLNASRKKHVAHILQSSANLLKEKLQAGAQRK
ncbi:hypothetical protein L1987_86151 [Smallanthus sonchifolius]|uniref:Uncharacterized protein n=1 Tax=Smallanthus sonchifolius TaxID=185202 RepID=A0ACB8XZR4_9ASTR|nr:hypothetical protein L1987_86151 [Smallanthus sonchifolius]